MSHVEMPHTLETEYHGVRNVFMIVLHVVIIVSPLSTAVCFSRRS